MTQRLPTGLTEDSADDLHTATYMQGSREISTLNMERFTDDYTVVDTVRNGMSKMGYSFVIGILSSIMAYALGLPIGDHIHQLGDDGSDQRAQNAARDTVDNWDGCVLPDVLGENFTFREAAGPGKFHIAPRYSYWRSVFRVFFRKKLNTVILLLLVAMIA